MSGLFMFSEIALTDYIILLDFLAEELENADDSKFSLILKLCAKNSSKKFIFLFLIDIFISLVFLSPAAPKARDGRYCNAPRLFLAFAL